MEGESQFPGVIACGSDVSQLVLHTLTLCFFSEDPNARTREEGFTPLHFAARYTPRIIDRDIQLQESESGSGVSSVEVGKRSSSVQVVQYLVNLHKGRKVKVRQVPLPVRLAVQLFYSRSMLKLSMGSHPCTWPASGETGWQSVFCCGQMISM